MSSACLTLPAETGLCYLDDGELAFERFGNPEGPVVLIQGGISADRYVTDRGERRGWWRQLIGDGANAIDTNRFCVLGVDHLATEDGRAIAPIDQAHGIAALLQELGIERLHRFIGSSYGGMVGLALAAEHPELLDGLVAISAPHRSHPRATAWRAVQRRIVRATGDLRLARALAMTTYRGASEFATRFDNTPTFDDDGFARFPVEDYLDARGDAFAQSFSVQRFLQLSQALDLHDVDATTVRVPTLLIGARSDALVPIEQLRQLRDQLAGPARLVELDTPFGHDAFLKETDTIGRLLQEELS